MELIEVDDPADPRLDDFRNLTDADVRPDRRGIVIAEGANVVARLARSAYPMRAVIGVPKKIEALRWELADRDVPAYVCDKWLLSDVVGFRVTRGVLASASRPQMPEPDVLLSSARRSGSSAELGDAIDHTKREIVNLRALIAELRPAALDELGLGPAIETLASRSGDASGVSVTTRVALGSSGRLAPETESTVYRVVQEALTNVAKHADAAHVHVQVARSNGTVEVVVEDDGHGFDPSSVSDGLGLIGMRERVELTGGELEIRCGPGTRVSAHLPA